MTAHRLTLLECLKRQLFPLVFMLIFGMPMLFIQSYPIVDYLRMLLIQYAIGALIITGVLYRHPRIATHTAQEIVDGFLNPRVILYHIGKMYLLVFLIYLLFLIIFPHSSSHVDIAFFLESIVVPEPFIALGAYYSYVISREGWRRNKSVFKILLIFLGI